MDNLKIKLGARCVLTWNINTVDNLVNGSSGTIVGIEKNRLSKHNKVDAIMVKFDDTSAGLLQRQRYSGNKVFKKYESIGGTPIFPQDIEYNIPRGIFIFI